MLLLTAFYQRDVHSDRAGVKAMFQKNSTSLSTTEDDVSVIFIQLKSVILLDRARQLAAIAILPRDSGLLESFWTEIAALEAQTTTFLHSLPCIQEATRICAYATDLGEFTTAHICKPSHFSRVSSRPWIVGAHTMARGTLIELHHISASYDPAAYIRMVREAENMADIIKAVEGMDVCQLLVSDGVCIISTELVV